MKYKFAFDLGSTSCGWAVVNTDEDGNVVGLADMGVRIFPDGRDAHSKEPLQVARRTARGMRVRNDRILQRRHKIIDLLKTNGMIYDRSDERENPYKLRAEAVDKEITLKQFGRIMYNLSLRRGFKSNRKEDKDSKGKTKQAMKNLENALEGQTLGQYLWKKFSENKAKENIKIDGKKQKINHTRFADNEYDNKGNLNKDALYPSRAMYEDEFDRIWSKQAEFYDILKNEDLKNDFHNAIFYQRPLKPQQRGFCEFEDGEFRIYKAHPLFQRFRTLQTINKIKVDDKDLTQEQRELLKKELFEEFKTKNTKAGTISFSDIRTILGLKKGVKINLEKNDDAENDGDNIHTDKTPEDKDDKKDDDKEYDNIYADKTAYLLSRLECFGEKWFEIPFDEQCSIVDILTDCVYNNLKEKEVYEEQQTQDGGKHILEDDEIKQFLKEHYNLDYKHCENIINANLEPSTGSLSKKAIEKILPYLEEGSNYDKACKSAGYHHSLFDGDVEMLSELPYYGDVLKKSCVQDKDGNYRITNISVHVALNQLRLIVNELIKKYGNPDFVAVEIARDLKMGTEELKKLNNKQNSNKKENDKITKAIKEANGNPNNAKDREKYKLWELCQKRCVYTGKQISATELFSKRVHVDHILPFSKTFNNGFFNKVVCFGDANKDKGNRTPYEAFKNGYQGQSYEEILDRVKKIVEAMKEKKMFKKKTVKDKDGKKEKVDIDEFSWRFKEDAMEKFKKQEGLIDRQLNDTKYMSRLAVQYLKYICKAEYYTDEEGKEHRKNNCYGLPGTMTYFCRKGWGINWLKDKSNKEGYRSSHAHHAVDAFVVACMTRGQLQKIASMANWIEEHGGQCQDDKLYLSILFKKCKKPFDTFDRERIYELCDKMPISFKPKLKNPKQENSTVGALCEDTAYSLLEFYRGLNGVFVKREDAGSLVLKDLPNIIDTQADKLRKEYGETEEAFNKFKEYCEKSGIKKIRCKSFADVSTYIPIFKTKEERDEYHKAYEDWFVFEGRSPANETEEQKQKRKEKEQQLLKIVQQKALKAYKWFVGGNNFCADVYQISPRDKVYTDKKEQGSWKVEVLSNYMATLNKGQALWRKKHPTARLVMRLKIDDMVMGEFSKDDEKLPKGIKELVLHRCKKQKIDKVEILFRVKYMRSDRNQITFIPDFVAKDNKDYILSDKSANFIKQHKIRKVFVSPAGKLIDNGFSDKWNDTKCD